MNEKYFFTGMKAGKTYMASEWMKRQIEQMAQPSEKPRLPFGIKIVANDIVPENEIWMVKEDNTGVKFKMEPPKLPDLTEQQMTMAARTFAAIYARPPEPVFMREYPAEWMPSLRLEDIYRGSITRLDKRKKRRLKRKGQWNAFEAMRSEFALPDEIKKVFK